MIAIVKFRGTPQQISTRRYLKKQLLARPPKAGKPLVDWRWLLSFNQNSVYFQINFQPFCRVFGLALLIERAGENTVAFAL